MKNWVKLIWTALKGFGATWLAIKFGMDAEYLVQVLIINNLKVGVPLGVILQQAPIPNLLMLIAVVLIGIDIAFDELSRAIDLGRWMVNKDYREVQRSLRWFRKECRRLKKLEGC